MFFDTHIHLDFFGDKVSLHKELAAARQQGIRSFLVPGVRPEMWPGLVELANREADVWVGPGIHPQAADCWTAETAAQLESLLRHPKVVAIGEIGLDGLLPNPSRSVQEQAFREQVRLAVAVGKPMLIHCRRAFRQTLDILKEEKAEQVGGIFHAFSGSTEIAQEVVRQNFAIGLGGILTFDNARRTPQVACEMAKEWLVLETDAPDLAPEPHRGESNRPCYLTLIARRLAELRNWDLAQCAEITTANACRVLNLTLPHEVIPAKETNEP